jgi:hypothetical protein
MTFRKFVVVGVGMGVLLGGGPPVSAHEMTERYIPIGQSPGMSGKYSGIGKVQATNPRDRTVVIVGSTGTWSAKVTERTRIWLDRSKLRLTNLKGTFADLRPGATVEVKHEDHQRGVSSGPAEWIKVEVSAPR